MRFVWGTLTVTPQKSPFLGTTPDSVRASDRDTWRHVVPVALAIVPRHAAIPDHRSPAKLFGSLAEKSVLGWRNGGVHKSRVFFSPKLAGWSVSHGKFRLRADFFR